jgi:hypothetical protein
MADVEWGSLEPILREMADRIQRIEQFLAASGFQGPNQPSAAFGGSPTAFGTPPAAFGQPDPFAPGGATVGQMAAAAHGIDLGGNPDPTGGPVPQYIIDLVRSNRKIEAIKEYRSLTGMGLADAKHVIDQFG